jgi:type I restriction enzyme, S subunit
VNGDSAANTWPWAKLGDLFEIQQGKALSKKARRGITPRSFLRTANVLWGKLALDVLDQMDFSAEEEAKYQLEGGDLLVCEGGEIGRTAIWGGELDGCYYQNHLHRCRASDQADPGFYMYWMQYAFLIANLYLGHANVTTIANLSKSRLAAFEVPHPPLPEQRVIAHVLGTVQRAKEQTEQVIVAAQELKRSLIRHLLDGGFPVVARGGDIKEWETIRLDEVCDFRGGTQPPKSTFIHEPRPGYVRLLQIRDFDSDDHATYVRAESRLRMVDEDDVLIGRYGASVGKILRGKSGAINVAIVKTLPDLDRLDPSYLQYLLQDGSFQEFVRALGGRSAQAGFNKGELGSFEIPLPRLAEQRHIAEVIAAVEQKIRAEVQHREALDTLLDSLLYDLMTARLRVDHLASAFAL